MLREEEARTKSCPLFSVFAALAAQIEGASFQTETPGNCQGSDCMMWRWERAAQDCGYCGLAREAQQ